MRSLFRSTIHSDIVPVAVETHCASGPNRGHYVSSNIVWLLFDKIDTSAAEDFHGLAPDVQESSETGYISYFINR